MTSASCTNPMPFFSHDSTGMASQGAETQLFPSTSVRAVPKKFLLIKQDKEGKRGRGIESRAEELFMWSLSMGDILQFVSAFRESFK